MEKRKSKEEERRNEWRRRKKMLGRQNILENKVGCYFDEYAGA